MEAEFSRVLIVPKKSLVLSLGLAHSWEGPTPLVLDFVKIFDHFLHVDDVLFFCSVKTVFVGVLFWNLVGLFVVARGRVIHHFNVIQKVLHLSSVAHLGRKSGSKAFVFTSERKLLKDRSMLSCCLLPNYILDEALTTLSFFLLEFLFDGLFDLDPALVSRMELLLPDNLVDEVIDANLFELDVLANMLVLVKFSFHSGQIAAQRQSNALDPDVFFVLHN